MADTDETERDASDEDGSEEQPRSKLRTLLVVVLGILLGGGAGAYAVGPAVGSWMAERSASNGGGGGGHGEAEPAALASLENMVVNPAGSGGSRFLLLSISVKPTDQAMVESLAGREPELRDALLRLLGRKTVEELSDIELRDELTGEMQAAIESIVGEGSIERIYVPHYVLQ